MMVSLLSTRHILFGFIKQHILMKIKKHPFLYIYIFSLFLFSCATNPFTGKKTLALVGNDKILPSAFKQYSTFLEENKVVIKTADAERVKNIGVKIKNAAELWLKERGYSDYLKGYEWEYNLIDDKAANAWCMPGGKIVFYTGIMPICKTDAGVATVMGHEVAHALANHGQQRMSAGMLQQYAAAGLDLAVQNESEQTKQIAMTAYGVTTQYGGMLPFSRSHESESDMIGLTIMAIAGYNPNEAVLFWERMAKVGGESPPEFMSTHPSNATRIANIKSLIPKAIEEAAKYGVTFE